MASAPKIWTALLLNGGLTLSPVGPAGAEPILNLGTFHFREARSPNTLGVLEGQLLTFGGDFTPNLSTGVPGTTVLAAQQPIFPVPPPDPPEPLPQQPINLPYLNSPALPNQFATSIPYNAALTGSWQLTATNSTTDPTTVVVNTPAVGTAATPEFIRGFSLTGSGATPTFNWAPSSLVHASQTLFISDRNGPNNTARIIHIVGLAKDATTYSVPLMLSGGGTLELGSDYWVNINVNDTRLDGTLLSRARTIFAFRVQTTAPNNPVFLPTVGTDGVFHFDIPGVGSQTIFIDPPVAVGYQYASGVGNPNFASVLLPLIGDGLFTLSGCNGASLGSASAGIVHSFGPGGLNCFRVNGIEVSAGIDPNDPTAFPTGLTFTADGQFTGTMTPLTADLAPVPEPATLLLLGSTLAGVGLAGWRRRRQE